MISKQIFSLNFMFLCSLIEELCTKEENDKTDCDFNFGHQCRNRYGELKDSSLLKIISNVFGVLFWGKKPVFYFIKVMS